MLISNLTQTPEVQSRQALSRVYALLIRLADEKETATSDASKSPKQTTRETQNKDSKLAESKQAKSVGQDTHPDAESSRPNRRQGKPRTRQK